MFLAKLAKEHLAEMQGHWAQQKNIMILGQIYEIALLKNDVAWDRKPRQHEHRFLNVSYGKGCP